MSEPRYQVGDRVRVRCLPDINEDFRDRSGGVTAIASDGLIIVKLDAGRTVHFYSTDLDPLPSQQPPVQSAGPTSPTPERVQQCIEAVLYDLRYLLINKNKAYGNSALDPVRIFSKADPIEQLNVRIDDKLSRLVRGQDAGEDVELDLMGYLVLKQVAKRLQNKQTPQTNS